MSDLSTSFEVTGHRGIYVFSVLSLLVLVGVLCYAWYRNNLIDSQAPIVETCVKHRVTERVSVQSL